MQTARCTENGQIYSAMEFARLYPADLSRMRRSLRCPECGGQAFFRKSSRNRGAPCFGARPHAAGCSQAVQDYVRPDFDATEEQDGLPALIGRIVVDFGYGAYDQRESIETAANAFGSRRVDTVGGVDGSSAAAVRRRLSSLLRILIENPGFASSEQILEILGKEIAAKNMLISLLEVTERHEGCTMLFWGLLSDARYESDYSGGQLWLNGGGRDNVSFCVKADHVDYFLGRHRIAELEDLAGAYVLIFGRLQISQSGKRYCIIDDPDNVALRLT